MPETTIDRLYVDSVDIKPQDRDWSEGYGDTWEFYEAPSCPTCGEYCRLRDDGYSWTCPDEDCERHGDEIDPMDGGSEGPMMNYAYPLPHFDQGEYEAAEKIRDLPLCIVRWEDERGHELALTGGGMDLSWDICEAFMRLGYSPPVHFAADLPRMAGHTVKPQVVAACRRSLECSRDWAIRGLDRLAEFEAN